jgi:hypothetical protein
LDHRLPSDGACDPTAEACAPRVSGLEDWIPIRRPEHLARFTIGLRLKGLPE